jgi:hypothetical protein
MPKDATKNVDRYKIRGGDLNEFEFQKNQADVKESLPGNKKAPKAVKGAASNKAVATGKSAGKKARKKTAS